MENGERLPSYIEVTGDKRRCTSCGATETPLWRSGPMGTKTLCNACGVRWKKGKLELVNGEYRVVKRPAQPTVKATSSAGPGRPGSVGPTSVLGKEENRGMETLVPTIIKGKRSKAAVVRTPSGTASMPEQRSEFEESQANRLVANERLSVLLDAARVLENSGK